MGVGVTRLLSGPHPTLFPTESSPRLFLGPPRLTTSSSSSHGQARETAASGLQLLGSTLRIRGRLDHQVHFILQFQEVVESPLAYKQGACI